MLYCNDRFDCVMFMAYGDCRGCYDGYTQQHHNNDYDFDDADYIG